MTVALDIIVQSLRETNIIAIDSNPSPSEAQEGVDRLQSLVLSVLGNECGYIMEDWVIGNAGMGNPLSVTQPSGYDLSTASVASYTVRPQSRLVVDLSAAQTLDLDPMPQDGQRFSVVDVGGDFATYNLTLNGNGRRIEGATSLTLSTNSVSSQWLYRADKSNWVAIEPLDIESEMPFPPDFDDYFIISLAMRLNPRYGVNLNEASAMRLAQQKSQFVARYSQSRLRVSAPGYTGDPARPMGQ
jgi:hypothetical protein